MARQRRSARDWARLVREWEASGRTVREFCAARGLAPKRLTWWRWRLRRSPQAVCVVPESTVQLVPVSLEATDPSSERSDVVWELLAPSGHVLRVYEPGSESLRVALELLVASKRRP